MITRIRQVRWLDAAAGMDQVCDVDVVDGVPQPADQQPADETRDGTGLWLMPMLTDLAARCREPGATHKATLASEARAAFRRGIGTLVLPADTDPAIDSTAVVELILERVQRAGSQAARVLPTAALTRGLEGGQLSELATLAEAGCVAAHATGRGAGDAATLRRSMAYLADLGLLLMLEPDDPALSEGGVAHDGVVAARLGLPAIPQSAETLAVARALLLCAETGARLHLCRLSCAASLELVAAAKGRGLPVSCDVAMHQLYLSELDLIGFDPRCHVRPPLRRDGDRLALREAVRDGLVDAIVSDHQPHDADAKLVPFGTSEPGISALDSFLGLGLKLVQDGLLTPLQWLARCEGTPRRLLGHAQPRGHVLVDPESELPLTEASLYSKGKATPFLGWHLPGRIHTHWLPHAR